MPLGTIEGTRPDHKFRDGVWLLDDDDFWLATLLQDPIYATELLWDDPKNVEYHGCYRVRDYQYPLFRTVHNYAIFACARYVGKTESIKAKSFTHAFRRHAQNLLLTAPQLIHLLPLTNAIEARIRDCRLTAEFLDRRNQRTGFTHRPFGVDYIDNTQIVGRIPHLTGMGVKGQHQPDLLVDEGQDYPDKGWVEVHETVMKDTRDVLGRPDFHYEVYGVHSGDRSSGFYSRATGGGFTTTRITAIQRPGWSTEEKAAARAAYGGTSSPDYRRNILGEAGSAASAFFVVARLIACMDQQRDSVTGSLSSEYNTSEYKAIELRGEDFQEYGLPMHETLDLPSAGYKEVYAGMDIGLTNSPTVITIFAMCTVKNKARLKLIRRITLQRFRVKEIVDAWIAIGIAYGSALKGFGIDATGLGFPIMQAMEDSQVASQHLLNVTRGFKFNAKVPVGIQAQFITADSTGAMRDQYGTQVKEEMDPLTGDRRYVTYMPMIEASTRYIRDWIDSGLMMLPFDEDIYKDMMGETAQRVKAAGELQRKPNAFHILDAMRACAMTFQREEFDLLLDPIIPPVFDQAVFPTVTYGGQELGFYG